MVLTGFSRQVFIVLFSKLQYSLELICNYTRKFVVMEIPSNFRMFRRLMLSGFGRLCLPDLPALQSASKPVMFSSAAPGRWQFIVQIRHISFFGKERSISPPTIPEEETTSIATSSAPSDPHFTFLEQLQLETVKDFHFTDFIGGNSLVKEYDLFSWWSPASWFRLALEYMHFNLDLPWWLTIMCATVSLRLMMIFVPIASYRLMGRIQYHKKEIDELKEKIEMAQKSGNFLQTMEAQKEMKDFLRVKDIKLYRQFAIMSLNGAIFMTQFIAIKKLADVAFPGLNTGGLYFFRDLTAADPYYLLPLMSAATVAAVFKVGAETGGNQSINPQMQKIFSRVGPVMVFFFSTNVSAAVALYWCTSNVVSLIFAGIFKISVVRECLKIPQPTHRPMQQPYEKTFGANITQVLTQRQGKKAITKKARSSGSE